jgi:hypothetical protein
MSREQQDAGEPKVKVKPFIEGDAKTSLDVKLRAGQSICAARDPLYFSDGLGFGPVGGGTRWHASREGDMCFATDGAFVARLEIAKGPYVVASDLAVLWTSGVRMEPLDLPGVPGFARASGDGALWLLMPGGEVFLPNHVFGEDTPVVVNPAQLAWARNPATDPGSRASLTVTPGPSGRMWLLAGGNPLEFRMHGTARSGGSAD